MSNLAEFQPVDTTPYADLATLLKASGDPLRLEILRVLQRDTFGVLELSQMFDMRQSGMSHHLKVLSRAGLVEPQREGNAIFYRRPLQEIRDGLLADVIRQIFDAVDRLSLPPARQARILEIRRQRSEQSRAFFARFAEQFREQQELIAEYAFYAEPVNELLRKRFDESPCQAILEIGPGEGAFLSSLASLGENVIAVDNSAEMLEQARERRREAQLDNVELVLGEAGDILERGDQFDLIVANMVLHHVPSPADIFLDSAALLKENGYLIVSDLCSHDQDWVRDNCGDLWLGFEPEELTAWAADAGLVAGETLFIGLRNGFQVQVREFRKGDGG